MKNKILSRVYAMYGRMYILTRICNTNWLTYYFLYICYIFHAEPSKHLAMYSRVPSLRSGWRLLGWPRPSCWACEASCYVFWLILHFVQDDGLFSGWRYVFNVSVMLSLRSILLWLRDPSLRSGWLSSRDPSLRSGWRFVFRMTVCVQDDGMCSMCPSCWACEASCCVFWETFERSFTAFRMTVCVQDDDFWDDKLYYYISWQRSSRFLLFCSIRLIFLILIRHLIIFSCIIASSIVENSWNRTSFLRL